MADLAMGSRGAEVEAVQQALAAGGYVVGAIDGTFGSKTDAAVRYFQSVCDLHIDGVVGSTTGAALGLGTGNAPDVHIVMPQEGTEGSDTYTVEILSGQARSVTVYLEFEVDGKAYTTSPQDAELHPEVGRLVVFDVPSEARQHNGEVPVDAFVFLTAGGGAIAQASTVLAHR